MENGFYRRPLPEGLVPFASGEGRQLFREALAAGGMESYFRLAEQLHTQADPAFCGLSTLVMVLNTLAVDPGRIWKGPWRWFGEEMLDGCVSLETVRARGVTFGQLSCLARCNGAQADLRPASASSVGELRRDLAAASAVADGPVIVAAYSRESLGQTGTGHFSPLGGYHAERDLALVLDVARFKYPPHWVPLARLFEAMLPIDPDTGKSRGYLRISRGEAPSGLRYLLSCRDVSWGEIARQLFETIPAALAGAAPSSAGEVVSLVLAHLGPLARAVTTYPDAELPDAAHASLAELLAVLRATELYRVATASVPPDPDLATIILFALPDETFATLAPPLRASLAALRALPGVAPILEREIARVRTQIDLVRELAAG